MAMQKTHAAITGRASALRKYQEVIVGRFGLGFLLYFEFCTWLGGIPGALGIALRGLFWKRLFAHCGPGVLFGTRIILRHPGRIRLDADVVIGDGCILDGRHEDCCESIVLGRGTMLSNDVMLSCKGGAIRVGRHVGINARSIVQSVGACEVRIGDDCVIGQSCLLIGGGSYAIGDTDNGLIRECPMVQDGGVTLENNVWLGAKVTVLGGVRVASGAVAGAGAVLTRSVPPGAVCVGTPARVIRTRKAPSET